MIKAKPFSLEYDSNSVDDAMELLNIICRNPEYGNGDGPRRFLVENWAAQAAISRPGRAKLQEHKRDNLHLFIEDYPKLRWPRGQAG